MSTFHRKISFSLLLHAKAFIMITLDICFLALMINIGELKPETDYKVVKMYSYVLMGVFGAGLSTCLLVSYLNSKFGAYKMLNIQVCAVLIIFLLLIFAQSYPAFLILYTIGSLFTNYDINLNVMINWVGVAEFADIIKKFQLIKYLIAVATPFVATQIIHIEHTFSWEFIFGFNFLFVLTIYIYFLICFRGFTEEDFVTDRSQTNSPVLRRADSNIYVKKVKERNLGSWMKKLLIRAETLAQSRSEVGSEGKILLKKILKSL